jgi:hypothetical protein
MDPWLFRRKIRPLEVNAEDPRLSANDGGSRV